MLNQFSRTELLMGPEALAALGRARVAVFGIGGVGGYVAEGLARSGVGALDLVDHDRVSLTNLNRQVVALHSTVGQFKADVMARRIGDINPQCAVRALKCFYLPDTAGRFDFADYDYIVDAVDTVTAKLLLIAEADRCGTPIVSCMGAANKLEPAAFEVADIYDTSICPLAKIIRKECRKRGVRALKVVYSKEPALQPEQDPELLRRENCTSRSGIPGSTPFVPAVAGLIAASEVVKDLVAETPIRKI